MFGYDVYQLLFLLLVFAVASAIPATLYLLGRKNRVQARLDALAGRMTELPQEEQGQWLETLVKIAGPLAKLSVPDEGWEKSELRRRFMQAGLRDPSVPVLFFGIKSALAFGLPVVFWVFMLATGKIVPGNLLFLYVALLCGIGFYAPNLVLGRMVAARQQEIIETFPDAIDLLTICVEAGLGLDGALARVAREIRLRSEVLADELELVGLEFRAGGGKERALRNLALRTGVDDIDTLVAMLVQSEKFGTGVGEALRTHSDMLRVKRQQRAEEKAAKVAVKLIFPLIMCIFPAILITVAGPAVIRIAGELRKMVGGG